MEIEFKKREGRKNIITYKREGKDDYWIEADNFLILHDLSHYAIESTLQYTSAFWGLIKAGVNPTIFENKEERDKILISEEAWYTECLANLFLIELTQGEFENFNAVFKDSFVQMYPSIPFIEMSSTTVNQIRTHYNKLVNDWKLLKEGGSLLLTF